MSVLRALVALSALSALSLRRASAGELSSLTFVIDDTSSMADDIARVRRGAAAIFDTALAHRGQSQIDNYILVTFNDNSPTSQCEDLGIVRAKTKDRETFMAGLDAISVGGGATDCEECALAGLSLALEQSRPRSSLYVFTDATAKDHARLPQVQRLALDKRCQIVFVLTGLCGASPAAPGYQAYVQVARVTGGQVFHIDKHSVDQVLEYVKMGVTGHSYQLHSGTLPPGASRLAVTADPLMGELLLSIASDEVNRPAVRVRGPDGTPVDKRVIVDTDKNKVYAFNAAKPGSYAIEVSSAAEARAVVSAASAVDVEHGFSSVRRASLRLTSALPAPGAKSYLLVKLNKGDIPLRSVQFRDEDDRVLRELPLAPAGARAYCTDAFDPPAQLFRVAIIGYHAASDSNVTRVAPTMVTPKTILPGEVIPDVPLAAEVEGPARVLLAAGAPLRLTCAVRGHPAPDVVWTDDDKTTVFSSKTLPGKNYPTEHLSVLEVPRVTEHGGYTCTARARAGPGRAAARVDVRAVSVPASIEPPQQPNRSVVAGRSLLLPCAAAGAPPPSVMWTHRALGPAAPPEKTLEWGGARSLRLEAALPAQAGLYTCTAFNRAGSASVQYSVRVLEGPELDKSAATEVTVTRGLSAKLECKLLKGKPKPSITWYFRRRAGDGDAAEDFHEVPEWRDQESAVVVAAEERAGTYECRAANEVAADRRRLELRVEYPPTILTRREEKDFIKAIVGVEVTVPCAAAGRPAPRVQWARGGAPLPAAGFARGPRGLTFVPQLSHAGAYTCRATNHLGSDSRTVRVDVTVPATIAGPRSRRRAVPVGGDVTLPCEARGDPAPRVKWTYRRHGDARVSREKIMRRGADGALRLARVQPRDAGWYSCVALNAGGSRSLTYELQVFAPPAIVNTYKEKRLEAVEGDLVLRVACAARGRPAPAVAWSKDGAPLPAGPTYAVEDGALLVRRVPRDARGTYACEARSALGAARDTYELHVLQYPPATPAVRTVRVEEGQSADVECPLPREDGDQLRWFKDGALVAAGALAVRAGRRAGGDYTCRVVSRAGARSAAVRLLVEHGPRFSSAAPERVRARRGPPARLDCTADSAPEAEVTWYHDDKRLLQTGAIYYFPEGIHEPGRYRCEVKNIYGNISRTFYANEEYCVVDSTSLDPIMSDSNHNWLNFETSNETIVLSRGTQVFFFCPNGFTEFPNKEITGFCDDGSSFVINGEKYDYSNFKCKEDVIHIAQRTGVACMPHDGNDTEKINVGYKVVDDPEEIVYEVCFNKTNESPIYTKIIMQESLADDDYETTWSDGDRFQIDFAEAYKCDTQTSVISYLLGNRFHVDDKCCFSKRQLVSSRDVVPGDAQRATYSYYNAVPACGARSANWDDAARRVRRLARAAGRLLLWAGAAGRLRFIADRSDHRQQVPLFLWKVVQHPPSGSSLAIIQVNVPDLQPRDVGRYTYCEDRCGRVPWMRGGGWRDAGRGYTYCCSLVDFERAFGFAGVFEPNMNLFPISIPDIY